MKWWPPTTSGTFYVGRWPDGRSDPAESLRRPQRGIPLCGSMDGDFAFIRTLYLTTCHDHEKFRVSRLGRTGTVQSVSVSLFVKNDAANHSMGTL